MLLLILKRELILDVLASFGVDHWAAKSVDNFSLIGLALIWLAVIIYSQHYYAKGAERGRLWRNFTLLTAIQLLVVAAAQLIPVLLGTRRYGPVLWMLIGAEGAVAFALIVLPRLLSARKR